MCACMPLGWVRADAHEVGGGRPQHNLTNGTGVRMQAQISEHHPPKRC
jgi:hypothetical protein